jgi:hypothetical protein
MAHEILGSRFLGRGQPAWHGLGRVFDENVDMLVSDAVKEVAGDIKVHALPVQYINHLGRSALVPDYQVIVRKPTKEDANDKIFGVTTEKWEAVDYHEMSKVLDELGKTYKVESCGLIQEGSLCFLSLRGSDFSVVGDEMKDYFIVNLSNQPGNSHKVLAAPVRVVCKNTNLMAQSQASISLSVKHSAGAKDRIGMAATLVSQFKEMTKKTRDIFELMAKTNVDKAGMDRIFAAAWPKPTLPSELRLFQNALSSREEGALKDALGPRFGTIIKAQESYDRACERVGELRLAAVERFEGFKPTNLRGTVWAGYNAVTEIADWREGRGADISSVWGTRAQEKVAAFSEALALAGMN